MLPNSDWDGRGVQVTFSGSEIENASGNADNVEVAHTDGNGNIKETVKTEDVFRRRISGFHFIRCRTFLDIYNYVYG